MATKTFSVKISLSELIAFKKNSDFIKTNSIIPALANIKFDDGTITKNNLHEFIIQKTPFMGKFLVEERVLFNFINYAAGDILFTIKDNKVILSDGNTTVTSQNGDIETFAVNEEPGEEKTVIEANVLEAIATASKFAMEDEFHPVKPYVFVGANGVAASDAMIAYYKKFDTELPEIILSKPNAAKIGSFLQVTYSKNASYDFFETGNLIYGFVKPEAKFIDLGIFFKFEKGDNFIVNKSDLINFNDACVSISPSKAILPVFQIKEANKLSLSMNDNDYEIDIHREVECNGTISTAFKYIASLMSRLLKTVPDGDVTFYPSNDKCYIIGESGFNSLIMKII